MASTLPRAAGYARVSTDDQAEKGYSLPEQEARIRAHCETRGYPLVAIINEDFTGKVLDRPGLSQITKLAETRAFEVLVCVKLDRLARANHLRRIYEDRMAELGVRVEYAEQHFEQSPSGRLHKGVMGEFAEYEWEVIRDRTMKGRRQKAEQRQLMPMRCRPYGYHQVTKAEAALLAQYHNRAGELTILEDRAAVVRELFTLCDTGQSLRGIARLMNDRGHAGPGGGTWNHVNVRHILVNPTYKGTAYFGQTRREMNGRLTRHGNPSLTITPLPRNEWLMIPCPAIVTPELWERCQTRIQANGEFLRGRPSRNWPLHGTIRCGLCEERYGVARPCHGHAVVRGERMWRYYTCVPRKPVYPDDPPYCGVSMNADRVEALAIDALRRAAEPGRLADEARRLAESARRETPDPAREYAAVRQQLAAVDHDEEEIANLLLAGISRHIVERKLGDIHARRAQLQQREARLRGEMREFKDPEEAAREAEEAAGYLRDALPAAEDDPEALKRLFRIFLRVRIFPDRKVVIRAELDLPVLNIE